MTTDSFSVLKTSEMSPGYLRQRRNLLLISFIMPVFFLSNATVEKINLLGTVINIQNPAVIKWAIVVLFGYFLWRYYIYRGEDVRLQVLETQKIRAIGDAELESFKRKTLKLLIHLNKELYDLAKSKIFYLEFSSNFNPETGQYQAVGRIFNDRKLSLFHRERAVEIYGPAVEIFIQASVLKEPTFGGAEQEKYLQGDAEQTERIYHRDGVRYGYKIKYNVIFTLFLRQLTSVRFAIKKSYFSDYNLPFLVALISIIATSYSLLI